jgi:hypothetical protein
MKKGSKDRDSEKLVPQLDQLRQQSAEELIKQWQALFGVASPKKLRASLLVQGIAYRLQEKALGGLKPSTLRLLERIADDTAASRPVSTPPESSKIWYPREIPASGSYCRIILQHASPGCARTSTTSFAKESLQTRS